MENDINLRIKEIREHYRLTQKEFAETTGIAHATLGGAERAYATPSVDVIYKIHTAYPIINMDWLITGRGKMMLDNTILKSQPILPSEWESKYFELLEQYNECLEASLGNK